MKKAFEFSKFVLNWFDDVDQLGSEGFYVTCGPNFGLFERPYLFRYRLGAGVQRPVRSGGPGLSPGGSPGVPGDPNYAGCGRRTERGERGSVLTTFTSVDCGPLQTLTVSPNCLNVPTPLAAMTQSNHVVSPTPCGQRSALTTLPETPSVYESVELRSLDDRLIICNNNAMR